MSHLQCQGCSKYIWEMVLGSGAWCWDLVYNATFFQWNTGWFMSDIMMYWLCFNVVSTYRKKSMVGSLYTKTRYKHLIHFKPWHAVPKICFNSYCSFQILHLKWACLKNIPEVFGKANQWIWYCPYFQSGGRICCWNYAIHIYPFYLSMSQFNAIYIPYFHSTSTSTWNIWSNEFAVPKSTIIPLRAVVFTVSRPAIFGPKGTSCAIR